jgi:ribose 5-phosphate isomerase B
MRLAVGADESTHLTGAILQRLKETGHKLQRYGPLAGEKAYWPEVAQQVAEAVSSGEAEEGILLCWTGTGVSMAANKVPGVRAALCDDAETARGARLWNDANLLCLSIRRTSEVIAVEILDAWFAHSYQPNDEDDTCLTQLREIEKRYLLPK